MLCYLFYAVAITDASDKHLLLAATSARQKYLSYMEDKKKKKECSGKGQKRKLLNDEIEELQKKKRCLHTDIDSLTASADEYAENTEQTQQVSGLPSLTASEDLRWRRAQT